MSAISLGITGAAGRMGRRLVALAAETPEVFKVVCAMEAPGSPELGKDAGVLTGAGVSGLLVTSGMAGNPQVVIDFTVPAATRGIIAECVSRKIPLLVGTTGLTAADQEVIDAAGRVIPILQAANTSLGVNLLLSVAAQIARQLGSEYDIEIVEAHHNQKKDAPSGTALALAGSICAATGRDLQKDLVHGRVGHDAKRQKGTVGMHAVRMGDVVGEHTVFYATGGERIELKHVATTRDTFARGALRAARFLAEAKVGRWTMRDVLGM